MSSRHWFRRRRIGFGWRPVTWQGWLVTLAAAAIVVAVGVTLRGSAARFPVILVVLAAYAAIAVATGGTHAAEEAVTEEPPAPAAPETAPARRERAPVSGPDVVVVDALTKRFGDRIAVDALSFAVTAGEVFGFLGPNGAGKTTTVRMLATLITPTSGTARVAGLDVTAANGLELRQRIAVMPENPGLYLRLTVAENLEYFAGLYGIADPKQRIVQALERVNLAARANDLCSSLSKGLRQRVGLA